MTAVFLCDSFDCQPPPPSGSLYSNAECFGAFLCYLLLLLWCYIAFLSHWSLCFTEVSNVLGRECDD